MSNEHVKYGTRNKRNKNPNLKVIGINLTLNEVAILEKICSNEFRNKSDQMRFWINKHWEENYKDD